MIVFSLFSCKDKDEDTFDVETKEIVKEVEKKEGELDKEMLYELLTKTWVWPAANALSDMGISDEERYNNPDKYKDVGGGIVTFNGYCMQIFLCRIKGEERTYERAGYWTYTITQVGFQKYKRYLRIDVGDGELILKYDGVGSIERVGGKSEYPSILIEGSDKSKWTEPIN